MLKKPLIFLYIIIACFAVYGKTITFGLTGFDDNYLVVENFPFLKDISNVVTAFSRDVFYPNKNLLVFLYRPVLTISLILDTSLNKNAFYVYHITNIVLHSAASCLVALFLMRLGYRRAPSLFAGLVFAVHPVLSQAVAWIPGRNDSLLAIFAVASFMSLMDFIGSGRFKYYSAHILFMLLALFTKETAIILPVLSFIYLRFCRQPPSAGKRQRAELFAGWIISIGIWFFARKLVFAHYGYSIPIDTARSLAIVVPAIVQYAGKILFPFNMSVMPSVIDTALLPGVIAVILISAAAMLTKTRSFLFFFGLGWFVLFLAPLLLYSNSYTTIADCLEHRVYLPMVGFFIALFEIGAAIAPRIKRRSLFTAAASVSLAILAATTYLHIDNFANALTFWKSAARSSPRSAEIRRILGEICHFYNMDDEALGELRTAVRLNSKEPFAHSVIGNILAKEGRFDEAESEYKAEIALNPGYSIPYVNLGVLYYKEGNTDKAAALWKTAIRINPRSENARRFLEAAYK